MEYGKGMTRKKYAKAHICAVDDESVRATSTSADLFERLLAEQPVVRHRVARLALRLGPDAEIGAVAPVSDNRCPACRVALSAVAMQAVRDGRFVNCANCARFLARQPASKEL